MSDPASFVVVTGGPGSGKSTLIDAPEEAGFARSVEAGRAVIQDQVAIDGPALPWRDPDAFAEAMLSLEMRSHHAARALPGPVMFDRGVPDVIGYLRMLGRTVPPHMDRAARHFRYARLVFVAPPWPAIFTQDAERKQDFDEAVRTFEAMVSTWRDYGYDLCMLPLAPVAERVRFVRGVLARQDPLAGGTPAG
ncbi:ATPase [Rhodoplanes elegans]|uniref:ATPase n=1 Tax=Rhodoplanes elegans TaxID=29408 RepID=A0A327K526_9BRAD|nr:AAA family ATPase [Rhodoplanes elegans]MBK5961102.1 ATPase [Rhodoplanes elegans]RAI32825.1 ATPase [Rhodoplanes elegans]